MRVRPTCTPKMIKKDGVENGYKCNKNHSENADITTSVTFDLDVWLYVKVKNNYVIICRFLYCTLVPCLSVIVFEIWPIVHFFVTFDHRLWPSSFVKVTFTLFIRWTFFVVYLFICSIEFEIWTIVCRKLQWRHNDVIIYSIFYEIQTPIYQGHI